MVRTLAPSSHMVEGLSPPFVDAIEKEEIGKKSSVVLIGFH